MHLVQWRIRSGLGILLVLHFSLLFGESNGHERLPVLYKDSRQSVHVRVQDLLSRMTLEEKIGQMTQIEKTVANSTVLEKFKIGQP